ncbi:MAG TPA: phosphate acyltransferase PlsX [Micropepsaceae bacterium]|nr:phosphate acyltransferase PlsX [Micropepsaceae bacterium]
MAAVDGLIVSIDAMGGDNAPDAIVAGVALSRERHPYVGFQLHGDPARLQPLVQAKKYLADAKDVVIVPASDVVGMADKPSAALRRGKETSMWRAIDAVREGKAKAVVSAGNTGALMAMSLFQLRTMAGIARPAIAAIWPTMRGQSIVLDVGANASADARQLVEFAVMGEAFARSIYGLDSPSLGLLNVGTEEIKGNEDVKAAAQMLRELKLPIDFRGFVEGDDISAGTVDVVVTDGFTGNIALKAAEGTAKLVAKYLRDAMRRSFLSKLGGFFAAGAFNTLRMKMDPRSVNGGVLLGLNGISVKSHGSADALSFATAVDLAIDLVKHGLIDKINHDIARMAAAIPATGQSTGQA